MANGELLDRLQQLVLKLDQAGVEETTREALAAGLSPQDIISKGLAAGMELVGQGYEEGELFVPELMLSARATLAALELLRPHLAGQGVGPPGKIVLGTVQGDNPRHRQEHRGHRPRGRRLRGARPRRGRAPAGVRGQGAGDRCRRGGHFRL